MSGGWCMVSRFKGVPPYDTDSEHRDCGSTYEGNLAIIVGDGKVLRVTHTWNVRLRIGDELLNLKIHCVSPS